jgi:hypothetical protein
VIVTTMVLVEVANMVVPGDDLDSVVVTATAVVAVTVSVAVALGSHQSCSTIC